ncbi:MAG: AAA family ATPase [Bacteroidales bacterium]|nr:AAA family ATPase [Bacteroidales bacterium]
MRIKQIKIQNYRTLENVEVTFNGYYTAISGKNNAGKSNIVRAIKTLVDSRLHFRIRGNSITGISNFNWKEEVTSWKIDKKEDIKITAVFEIIKDTDTEIYKYLTEMIFKNELHADSSSESISLQLSFAKTFTNDESYTVIINKDELTDNYKKKELIKRLQTTEFLTFHNSTMNMFGPFDDSMDRMVDFISSSDSDRISKKKEELLNLIRKSLKSHQQKLTGWLGKLEEKYEVSLSVQGLNFEREPIDISLKEKGGDVTLDNWGSGTRNRTLIFLKLFNAVKRAQNESDTDRIKPIIIIEEPESFLHPQAQAEFGRVLQDLADELKIQIIITTHSPYFLSIKSPFDNILLERTKNKNNPCTSLVSPNADGWWKPFVDALGIKAEDFGPMKEVIFNGNENILIVEGTIDKGYLEFLQSHIHGANALRTDIEIVPINGVGALKNTVWVSFIKRKFKNVCIMIDLDMSTDFIKSLESAGFKKGNNLFIVGTKETPNIEGYVPADILSQVTSENPNITRKLMNNKEAKEGRDELKSKLLKKFVENNTTCGLENFYKLVKDINNAYK